MAKILLLITREKLLKIKILIKLSCTRPSVLRSFFSLGTRQLEEKWEKRKLYIVE